MRAAVLLAVVLLANAVAAQPASPAEQLYPILAEAARTGWTADRRRDAAELTLALGDVDASIAHYEAALLIDPHDELTARRAAELAVQNSRWDHAADALRTLIELVPDDPWANLHLGLILAPAAPQESLTFLRRAAQTGMAPPAELIETLEQFSAARSGLPLAVGAVMTDAALYGYAERAFELAVALDPDTAQALASVALVRAIQGKDGKPWLDEALGLGSESAQVYVAAGLYYRAVGQDFISLEMFLNALSRDPLNPEINAEVSTTYGLLGDMATADFWARQAQMLARGRRTQDDPPLEP
ncbi:MAG: tetratricopeptide repeat protein [Chloroflexi bacterium]|nr:tetratricopeptide repeat protein [Chloroflexota bacterium]